MTVCRFFSTFGIKEGAWEVHTEVGDSKAEVRLPDSTHAVNRRMCALEGG